MARIYIGNLPMDVTEKDIDDVFYKFGRIMDIDLKTPARPPAFGFVTFGDPRDAEEAVRARCTSKKIEYKTKIPSLDSKMTDVCV